MTFVTFNGMATELGGTGGAILVTLTAVHGATIVSLGWTSQGNASSLAIPQLFVSSNGASATIQFVNSGATVITVTACAVLALPDHERGASAVQQLVKEEVTNAFQA